MTDFATDIAAAYATDGPAIDLGRGVLDGAVVPEAVVQVPLAMMNRHGLIAGATGTGKTITAQLIAEQLSAAGVPVLIADVKGDVSGVGAPGGFRSSSGGDAPDRSIRELALPPIPPRGSRRPDKRRDAFLSMRLMDRRRRG